MHRIDVLLAELRQAGSEFERRSADAAGEVFHAEYAIREKTRSRVELIVEGDEDALARLDAEVSALESKLARARERADALGGGVAILHALSQKRPDLDCRKQAVELQALAVAGAQTLIDEALEKAERLAALRRQFLEEAAEAVALMQEARSVRSAAQEAQFFLPAEERLGLPKFSSIWDALRRLSIEADELDAVIGQRPVMTLEKAAPLYQRQPSHYELSQLAGPIQRKELSIEAAAKAYGLSEDALREGLRGVQAAPDMTDTLTAALA